MSKKISINNGLSFVSPEEALEKMDWDVILNYMDEGVCDQVHGEIAPCSNLEFLKRYLEVAEYDLIIG